MRFAGIGDEAAPALDGQLAALDRLGWRAVELRSVDRVPLAELTGRAFEQVAGVLADRDVAVVCVDSRIGDWSGTVAGDFSRDLAELATLADRCAVLGTRFVRIMSYPNAGLAEPDWRRRVLARTRELAARAEQAGLVLLHENCAGWAGSHAERALDLVESTASPALRLLFDTGNGIAHGYSATGMLAPLAHLVAHVHVKDARRGTPDPVYTVPGAGEADVAGCLRLLREHGYDGVLSLEPHLSLQPHRSRAHGGDAEGFVAAGRALEALARQEFPDWERAPCRT